MDRQYKLLSELLSDQGAFTTSPKTSFANYWGHCPPLPPSVYGPDLLSIMSLESTITEYKGMLY